MSDSVKLKRIKYKIVIFRVVACLVLYGIFGVFSFIYLRSYIALIFIIVFALLPVYSVMCLINITKHLKINLVSGGECIDIYQNTGIGIHVNNSSLFSSLKCLCKLKLCNEYIGCESKQTFNIPIVAKKDYTEQLVFIVCYLGKLHIVLEEVEVYDLFGIMKATIACQDDFSLVVLPVWNSIEDSVRAGLLEGCVDNTDESVKGTDYSDTFNIREYIPGDRIKDIHWKLLAKKDELLVKERIQSSESQLVIWIDSSNSRKNCEGIMSLTYSVLMSFICEGVLIRVLWYNFKTNDVNEFYISNVNEIKDLFEKIYEGGQGLSTYDLRTLIQNGSNSLSSFVRIGIMDGDIRVCLYEV